MVQVTISGGKQIDAAITSVHPEMVDCGPDQGRSEVETAGAAGLRRGFQPSENTELGRKMPFMDGRYLIFPKRIDDLLLPALAVPVCFRNALDPVGVGKMDADKIAKALFHDAPNR